jgi:integrase
MERELRFLKTFQDRHGRWRIYFRRRGFKARALPVPSGYVGPNKPLPADCLAFLAAYQAAMTEPLAALQPGEKRAAHGTVAWLVAEYFASLDFLGRPKSVQVKHRKHIEDFRVRRGERIVAGLEQVHFETRLAAMLDTPAAANQWRVAMRDLMAYAVKRGIVGTNPVAGIKKRSSGNPDGHHTWTLEQVEAFRRTHPIGAKARLALELMVRLALRRSDVIRLGPPDVRSGVLKYTQFKMREHTPSHVEVPIPADLAAIIANTPGTGIKRWLLDGNGNDFTESAFSHWFADMCDAAGLPRKTRPSGEWVRLCTPHGLRKRCLTDMAERECTAHEIMSVSGHLTLKELERYTRLADRARNAKAAMRKAARNRKETKATAKVSNLKI